MGKVLIPIDFSINCYNAFRYGMQLAASTGREVLVVHYHSANFLSSSPHTEQAYGQLLINRMRQFVLPVNHLSDFDYEDLPENVSVTYEQAATKKVANSIQERAERNDIDMVVMGTISSSVAHDKWLGSVSIRVSATCDRPVFLIPPGAAFKPFKRIAVANARQVSDAYVLWQIRGLADLYSAKVYFVHVSHPDIPKASRFIPWQLLREMEEKGTAKEFAYTIAEVEDKDLTRGLLGYVAEIKADLLVMINHAEDGKQKVIHESLTQDVALKAKLPIVIFHTTKSKELINSISSHSHFREH